MISKSDFDIVIVGSLAGNDLSCAEVLTRIGLRCCVMRSRTRGIVHNETSSTLDSFHKVFSEGNVYWYKNPLEFLTIVRRSRLILSFTGELLNALGSLWNIRHFLNIPPVINIMTGSDMTELPMVRSYFANKYRQYLNYVKLNWCAPYPHALKNILSLKVPNVVFLYFGFYLLPHKPTLKVEKTRASNTLRFFHPSHLDWKINDPGEHRNSSKGNDRFIKAFARAIKYGLNAYCVILDRGPDRATAKELINLLEVSDRFIWKTHLSREQLFQEYIEADVVVDQFDVGALGGISIEAMALGKPVMIYLQDNCAKLFYREMPPILNCFTEEEIYQQIMSCQDRALLHDLGIKAKEWVFKYHNPDTCLDTFLFYYTLLTGHQIIDYGWERNP